MSQMIQSRPRYACALLRDSHGHFLLQLRPKSATYAANQLTCFGGRCEPGETAEECVRRELNEELGWRPALVPAATVYLRDAQHLIATFHPLLIPSDITMRTEPGFVAVRAPPASLPGLPVSPWHRLVFEAVASGQSEPISEPLIVQLADPTAPDRSCNQ